MMTLSPYTPDELTHLPREKDPWNITHEVFFRENWTLAPKLMDLSQSVTGRLHFFDACFEGYPFATFQGCEMSSFPVDQSIILRHFEDQPDCSPQKNAS